MFFHKKFFDWNGVAFFFSVCAQPGSFIRSPVRPLATSLSFAKFLPFGRYCCETTTTITTTTNNKKRNGLRFVGFVITVASHSICSIYNAFKQIY